MRLIDANELYEKTAEWEAKALHAVEVTMNDKDETEWRKWSAILCERSAFKFDIADAPTVEAIPIEWLKNWNPKELNDTGYQVMRRIIDDWEKSNETD